MLDEDQTEQKLEEIEQNIEDLVTQYGVLFSQEKVDAEIDESDIPEFVDEITSGPVGDFLDGMEDLLETSMEGASHFVEEMEKVESQEEDDLKIPEFYEWQLGLFNVNEEVLDSSEEGYNVEVPEFRWQLGHYNVDNNVFNLEIENDSGVSRLRQGELNFILYGQDDEINSEAIYIAEELGLDPEYDEDNHYIANSRQRLKDRGNFEIDWGNLETDVPEEMEEKLREKLQEEGIVEREIELSDGEIYMVEDGMAHLKDGIGYSFEIYDEDEQVTDEAKVISNVTGIGFDSVTRHDGHIKEHYFPTLNKLREEGVIEAKHHENKDSREYTLNPDLGRGFAEEVETQIGQVID